MTIPDCVTLVGSSPDKGEPRDVSISRDDATGTVTVTLIVGRTPYSVVVPTGRLLDALTELGIVTRKTGA